MSLLAGARRLPSLLQRSLLQPLAFSNGHLLRGKRTRAMALQGIGADIVSAGDVVLRTEAQDVPCYMLGSQELKDLVQTMIDTMREAPGVGLAAPQIGVPLKVIVMEDRDEYMSALPADVVAQQQRAPFGPLVVVNPRLRAVGGAGARMYEGCLSVPGYNALVERYLSVECEGLTVEGEPLQLQASGWQARILQHECDHLQGILYVDRMLSRSFATRGKGGASARLPDDVPKPGPCTCCHPIDRAGHVRI